MHLPFQSHKQGFQHVLVLCAGGQRTHQKCTHSTASLEPRKSAVQNMKSKEGGLYCVLLLTNPQPPPPHHHLYTGHFPIANATCKTPKPCNSDRPPLTPLHTQSTPSRSPKTCCPPLQTPMTSSPEPTTAPLCRPYVDDQPVVTTNRADFSCYNV